MIDCFFLGRWDFLTNYAPSPLVYDGLFYPTVEHAYQAAKSLDQDERHFIASLETPGDTKKYAHRRLQFPDQNWPQRKDDVMLALLRLKYAPGSALLVRLLETGDQYLLEGNNWGDRYWGAVKDETGDWGGENRLGKLLMQVRNEQQSSEARTAGTERQGQ